MKRRSSCFSSSHPRSRSAVGQSLFKAASEISEIEYIDNTDHDEPFLDDTDDQQTLDSLEKELNELRNLAGNAIFFFHHKQYLLCLLPDSPCHAPSKQTFPFSSLNHQPLCLFS